MIPDRPVGTSEPPDEKAGPAAADKLAPIALDLFCQGCGYNLKGLTSDRCPECGKSLETVRLSEPQIPWVHRKQLGRFRAYWKTVYLAMFHQGRFCEEMARPVDYADSQRFRWVTILYAYAPILLATLVLCTAGPPPKPFSGEFVYAALDAVWPVVLSHGLILLYLAAATGVPSYFFYPRDIPVALQNRAIALSYYACGPLAVTVLPGAAAVVAILIRGRGNLGLGLELFAIVFPMAQLLTWLIDLLHISRRLMPQFRRRAYLIFVCVPTLWFVLAGLILFGIPLCIFYLVLIIATVG